MNLDEPLPPIPTSLTMEVPRVVGIALLAASVVRRQSIETVASVVLEEWAQKQIHDSEMIKRMMRGTPWEIK